MQQPHHDKPAAPWQREQSTASDELLNCVTNCSAFVVAQLSPRCGLPSLQVLNFILGFPVQLLGLLMLPYLGVRYLVDNESPSKDVGEAVTKVTKLLPGLDK